MAAAGRTRHTRILRAAEGYLELELPHLALQELERIRSLGHRRSRWYHLKAAAHRARDEPDEALSAWSRVLAEDPHDLEVLLGMAWGYRRLGQLSRSIAALQDACRAWPDEGRALFQLACCLAVAGEHEQALSWLGRAVRLDQTLRSRIPGEADLEPLRGIPGFDVIAGGSTS